MLQNLDKQVPMASLAALAGVSLSNFHYLFKLATGCTPNDLLIHVRVRRACELLLGTKLSVKEVAAELGYHDPFYFSRVFKSVTALAPGHYRQLTQSLQREIMDRLAPGDLLGNGALPHQGGLVRWLFSNGVPPLSIPPATTNVQTRRHENSHAATASALPH